MQTPGLQNELTRREKLRAPPAKQGTRRKPRSPINHSPGMAPLYPRHADGLPAARLSSGTPQRAQPVPSCLSEEDEEALQGLVTREGTQCRSGARRASLPQEEPAWPSTTRPPPSTAVTAKLVFAGAFGASLAKSRKEERQQGPRRTPQEPGVCQALTFLISSAGEERAVSTMEWCCKQQGRI